MAGTTSIYVITELSGPNVAGRKRSAIPVSPDGKQRLALTEEEARFELVSGAIIPDGQPLPTVPVTPRLLVTDTITFVRNGFPVEAQISDLLALLQPNAVSQPTGGQAMPAYDNTISLTLDLGSSFAVF